MDTNPTWDWSGVGSSSSFEPASKATEPKPAESKPTRAEPQESRASAHEPRTCRICFDTEQPKFSAATTAFGIATSSSRPTYESDDPELGRLLSPCKCKGSQKYVHEGCLNAWRLANPTEARNYWQCPTCKFSYRISRLNYASALSSKWAQIALTFVFVILSLFILGFIADPIFELWSDPVGTISDTVTSVVTDIEGIRTPPYEIPTTWYEHFVKGFFSLGIVGLVKTMFALSPWQWWNLRASGLAGSGGRRQGTGRARVENINYIFVLVGAITFLMGIWKGVRALSARVLKNVSDRVLDIDDDDDVPTSKESSRTVPDTQRPFARASEQAG